MILYNAVMTTTEEGLGVWYNEWHVIYETECFYMCLKDWEMAYFQGKTNDEIKRECKLRKRKMKKIAKRFSRFAHPEKIDALNSLIIKKKCQINHCRRNLAVVGEFINQVENNQGMYLSGNLTLKGTKDLIKEWFVFD